MADKTKKNNLRLLLLLLLVAVAGIAMAYRLAGYSAEPLPAKEVSGSDVSTTPTPSTQPGNEAKSRQSIATPTPAVDGGQKPTSTAPATDSFIQDFYLNNMFAITELSTNAAGGRCSITLTPTSGSPVTESGSIVSSGSYLSCDFGGAFDVSGPGKAKLTVKGANGKTDTREATF